MADALQDALAARNAQIIAAFDAGDTLAEIGARFGICPDLSQIEPAASAVAPPAIPPSAPLPAAADTGRALSSDGVRPIHREEGKQGTSP